MTLKPNPRTRHLSACYLHPTEPVTGFCAACLRDRLSFLDSSGQPLPYPSSSSLNLRRTKSVSASKSAAQSSLLSEPRRNSCDVRSQKTLSHLFHSDDKKNDPNRELKVESLRVSEGVMVNNVNVEGEVEEEGEGKTMQELIDLELFQNRKKKVREITSIFGRKMPKWNQKQRIKKLDGSGIGEYSGFGRRSCDTEPRLSIDANRTAVDESRASFDEPRASWDGYLIARTIPPLAPMLSVVDNAMMMSQIKRFENHRMSLDGKMDAIHEHDTNTSSGGSGECISDSSASQRRSSFDRSSSVRSKKLTDVEIDANVGVVYPTKLVITEKELKNWQLNSLGHDKHNENFESLSKDDVTDSSGSGGDNLSGKKSTRWRKVWGFINRFGDSKYQDFTANVIDQSVGGEVCEKQKEGAGIVKGVPRGKLIGSSSWVSARKSCDMGGFYGRTGNVVEARESAKKDREESFMERNRSVKYSASNSDNGMLRFYLTPSRSYGKSKVGKHRQKNLDSIGRNVLPLN